MPKLKSRRSIRRRFRRTKTGKIMYSHAGRRHLLGKKSRNRKRRLRSPGQVSGVQQETIKQLLPYG